MSLTQSQRVEVGSWYIDAIKRRIATRQKVAETGKTKANDDLERTIQATGHRLAKAHRLGDVVGVVRESSQTKADRWTDCIVIDSADGARLAVPVKSLPALVEQLGVITAEKVKAGDACGEAAFLTACLGNGPLARFQGYVSKLHAGSSAPTHERLNALLNDYLAAAREPVCKVG